MTHTIEASALLASGGREPPEDRIASGDSIGYLRYAPLVAGVLVACDPILLNQQTLVMTETLATFLAILALWCLARFDGAPSWFNAGLAGGAICLAVLCRPTFLPWLGLVGAVMVLMRGGNAEFGMLNAERGTSNVRSWFSGLGSRLVNAAAVGIVAAAIVSPWVIRNYREFGKPIATTTHGGFTLYLGNNEDFYRWLTSDTSGRPWESEVFTMLWQLEGLITPSGLPEQQHHEIERDQRAYEHATAAMQRAPWIAIAASLYRMAQLWSPLPHKLSADESTGRTLLRYATAAWYCGVYVLAAVGMWRLRRRVLARPWIWGVLLCLVFTAVHAFYWSNLRMRAPLMPFVAIVAAAGLSSSHTSPKRKRG